MALAGVAGRRTALRRAHVLFALEGIAEATILPFFPLLLLARGLAPAQIGALLALMALAGFLTNPLWGYAADRWLGAERALFASAGGAAALSLLLTLPANTLGFAATTLVLWAWRAPLASLADAIALDRLGASRGGYGRVRLWMSAGWAVAVVLWGGVLQAGTLDLVPPLYAATIVLVALWAKLGIANGRPAPYAREARAPGAGSVAVLPRLLAFLASLLLVNAAFAATWNFLALRITELGGGALIVGVAASLQAAAEIPVMRATPWLTRLIGHRGLYVAGCVVYAAVFTAWGLLSDPLSISLVKIAAGVGFAFSYVGAVVIVDDLVPPALRATGQGLAKAVSFGLAPITGSLLGGAVYGYVGPSAMFFVTAAAAGTAAAIAWFAIAEAAGRGEPEPLPVAASYEAQP